MFKIKNNGRITFKYGRTWCMPQNVVSFTFVKFAFRYYGEHRDGSARRLSIFQGDFKMNHINSARTVS